ncbi:hypothetical protein Tco_1298793, partial [Tanacetum coccineum]
HDPEHVGVSFRLEGELKTMSLLELGWRVGLYSKEQSRLAITRSGLRRSETVKAEDVLMGFLPTIGDGEFCVGGMAVKKVEEDDEVEEVDNEGAGGCADMYRNMTQGDCQIDPFLGCEADYPPYGYNGHMSPDSEYQFGPAPPSGSE